jgi:hypothetical protein
MNTLELFMLTLHEQFLLIVHILSWKGGKSMDKFVFLFLACILAGFALINVPLAGSPLASIQPITSFIGILAILVFSLVLILKGILALVGK